MSPTENLISFEQVISTFKLGNKALVYLPPQFAITSTPRKIKLPEGHRILLHYNQAYGPNTGSTTFIAVGNGAKYPINKPYFIRHNYDSLGCSTEGAFFSLDSLQITDFLMSTKSSSDVLIEMMKENAPNAIKATLAKNGGIVE